MFLKLDEALEVLKLNKDFSKEELEEAYKKATEDENIDNELVTASYKFLMSELKNNLVKDDSNKNDNEKSRLDEHINRKNEKLTNIYNEINYYKFMDKHNISLDEFLSNPRFQSHVVNIYNLAKDIYNNKEQYLKTYYDYSSLTTPNIFGIFNGNFSKTLNDNKQKKKNRIIYENRMETEFGTAENAIETVYNLYEEYIDYGFVLDKLDIKDLKKYILGDQERRNGIKAAAEQRLKLFLFECEKKVLNEETAKVFLNIHSNVYRKDIIMINNIEKYVDDNFDFSFSDIKCKPNRDSITKNIYDAFIKLDNNPNKLYSKYRLIYLITDVCHLMEETHKTIPDKLYVFNGNWDNIAYNFNNIDDLIELYKFSFVEGIDLCYAVYQNVKDTEMYKNLKLLDALKKIYVKYKAFKTINLFGGSYSMEKLATMDNVKFKEIFVNASKNKDDFEILVDSDPKYINYFKVYVKFKKMFENVSFNKAIEIVSKKCANVDDFSNSTEIEKLLKDDKVKFDEKLSDKNEKVEIKANKKEIPKEAENKVEVNKYKNEKVEEKTKQVKEDKDTDDFDKVLYCFINKIKKISKKKFYELEFDKKIELLTNTIKKKYGFNLFTMINRDRQKSNIPTLKKKDFESMNETNFKELILKALEDEKNE